MAPSPPPEEALPEDVAPNGWSATESEEPEVLDAEMNSDDELDIGREPRLPPSMLDEFLDPSPPPSINGNDIAPLPQQSISATPLPMRDVLEEFLEEDARSASIEEVILTPPSNDLPVVPPLPITYESDDEPLETAPRISRRRWTRMMIKAEAATGEAGLFKGARSSQRGESPPAGMRGSVERTLDTRMVDKYHRRFDGKNRINWALRCSLFEAFISQSTSVDEPNAPDIKVVNKIDLMPPDWEFQYGNQMLYTPSVPDPELGHGCGCDGPCDPESTTCLCVKRQQLYFYGLEGLSGFQYRE